MLLLNGGVSGRPPITGTPARAPVIGVYRRAEGALNVLCWESPLAAVARELFTDARNCDGIAITPEGMSGTAATFGREVTAMKGLVAVGVFNGEVRGEATARRNPTR